MFEAVPEHPTTETFLSYSSTGDHTCGIRASDKKAVCFGYMVTGIEGPSTDAYDVITTPYQAVCGVRSSDKKILCRGQSLGTLPGSPTAETATQLASYYSAMCAVLGTGRLKCWPGQGSVVPDNPPDNGTDTYSAVAMGPSGLCAIRTGTGEARCWAGSLAPPAGVAFKALAVGQDKACGIRATDDRIECWNDQTVSVDPFRSVSISSQGSVCGARLSDGKLVCVGPNNYGEAPTL